MKVEFITRSSAEVEECDWRDAVEIRVDGEKVIRFCDGEPEDNSIARNFNDINQIPGLLLKVRDAVKAGEPFEVEVIESDEI